MSLPFVFVVMCIFAEMILEVFLKSKIDNIDRFNKIKGLLLSVLFVIAILCFVIDCFL